MTGQKVNGSPSNDVTYEYIPDERETGLCAIAQIVPLNTFM